MSNCYDHEYKSNMLDSYYWSSKDEAKKNISKINHHLGIKNN